MSKRRKSATGKEKPLSIQESAVLKLIETGISTSQVELVARCNLPPTTINGLVKRLITRGVIRAVRADSEDAGRVRGRPQMHFEVPKRRTAVIVVVNGSKVRMQGFVRGQAVTALRQNRFLPDVGFSVVIQKIAELYALVAEEMPAGKCEYIALVITGFLDKQGVLQTYPFTPWLHKISIKKLGAAVLNVFKLPVLITTSSSAPILLKEFRMQRNRGATRICGLNIGDGVSSAAVDLNGFWGTPTHYRGDVANLVMVEEENPFGFPVSPNLEDLTCGYGLKKVIEKFLPRYPNSFLAKTVDEPPAVCYEILEQMHEAGSDRLSTLLGERFLKFASEALRIINTILEPNIIILSGYALKNRNYWKHRLEDALPGLLRIPLINIAKLEFPSVEEEEAMRLVILSIPEPEDEELKHPSGVIQKNLYDFESFFQL